MYPVGFYDLREAARSAVPVVSTAFRPIDGDELARNPFRVFTSMLAVDDERFFDDDLRARLRNFLHSRELFPPALLELASRAEAAGGLLSDEAELFLQHAVGAFKLSPQPVDRSWYEELERVSAVAADIGGVRNTHINHLTPRVLDIDELYRRMNDRGITMIDAIQGPPRWQGPDVLLRQTSFKALAEPRLMRAQDGSVSQGTLRVRFGEVEARGIALTSSGRARYDALLVETDRRKADAPNVDRDAIARQVWSEGFPNNEQTLDDEGLGFFAYQLAPDRPVGRERPPASIRGLREAGWVRAEPIVYEDFLPRSAAGIFQSNLTGEGSRDANQAGATYDMNWMAAAIDRPVHDPFELYEQQRIASVQAIAQSLDLAGAIS